jgi:hypothetical protein
MEQREQDKQSQEDAQKRLAAAKGHQRGKMAVPLPAVAPIGIHLRTSKNAKLPPIHAFLLTYSKLPKLRR